MLLLDEPTSGISTEEKTKLMDVVMDALKQDEVTILFVEHDMEIVERYVDRVLAFYQGEIICDAPPAEALRDAEGAGVRHRRRVPARDRRRPCLRCRDLDVDIGVVPMLRGIALGVPNGAMCGLIGRNGAGKTTLHAQHHGRAARARRTHRASTRATSRAAPGHRRAHLGIGYMPEDRRLVPDLTAEENILVPVWAIARRRLPEAARLDLRADPRGRRVPRAATRPSSPAASRRWWRSRAR